MKKPLIPICLAVAASLPLTATADDSRWYVTADVGMNFLGSEDLAYRDGTTSGSAKADFDPSFAGGATVGWRLNDQWRLEGELMYRRNEMDDITLPGIGASTEGDFASLSLGASALYDFNLFGNEDVTSFVGAGVVFVQEIDIDFEVGGQETSFETDDIGFQVQFGARYDFGERWFLDARVRYLALSGVELEFPSDTSRIIKADYAPVTVSAGIGYRF